MSLITHMTHEDMSALADEAANSAVALIQQRLGETDGGFAGMFFLDGYFGPT